MSTPTAWTPPTPEERAARAARIQAILDQPHAQAYYPTEKPTRRQNAVAGLIFALMLLVSTWAMWGGSSDGCTVAPKYGAEECY